MITTTDIWRARLNHLLKQPEITIRGNMVREECGASTIISMSDPFVCDATRNVSKRFQAAEAHWILSGDNRVATIAKYAPSIEYFSDNGTHFQGAYGPKVTEQLHYVCETLAGDRASRQAVLSIWRENPRCSKDIPCTVALQFLIREGKLNCIATMRSSDIWLGWVYDVFNFSCISYWIKLALQEEYGLNAEHLDLGWLKVDMGSSHLYERNYQQAENVLSLPVTSTHETLPAFNTRKELMDWLVWRKDR